MGRKNVWRLGSGVFMSVTSLCPSCPVGPLIGKYCGTKTPSELRSATGILSLTFHTDMAVAKDGFSARYYLVHQEPLESELAGWETDLSSHGGCEGDLCKRRRGEVRPQGNGAAASCWAEMNENRVNVSLGAHFFKEKVCMPRISYPQGKSQDHLKPQNEREST